MNGLIAQLAAIVGIIALLIAYQFVTSGKIREVESSDYAFIITGFVFILFGLGMLRQYILEGHINTSAWYVPFVVEDEIGAYLHIYGSMCIGAMLVVYNLISIKNRRSTLSKPPNKSQERTD